jgi:RNA polymerase sigma-70 factor (ECF subfamily)
MSAPADELISEEEERALHQRLVAGEETAPSDIARVFLDSLIAWLKARNSAEVPEELCIEASEDALIALVKSPQSYKPERGKRLFSYLRMSAQGDLRNILRREGRHWKQITLDDVELSREGGKYLLVNEDPSLFLERQEENAHATKTIVGPVRDGLTESESRALDLILQGERKTMVFAEALGITHLPTRVQRTEVKRVKDKLKKRLERKTSDNVEPS